jgi:surfeit locus 1 family protein
MLPNSHAAAVPRTAGARRRPAWIPTAAALVTVVLCVLAGHWQQQRMHEKEALLAQIRAAAALPSVPLPTNVGDWHAWRFRAVTMTGRFDARHQFLIDNRLHEGRVGFGVITPFILDDGRTVLVDRGFVAAGASRAVLPDPRPPQGDVVVRGRVDVPSAGYLELGDRPPSIAAPWQNVDPQRFAQATGIAVPPIVVDALDGAGDGSIVAEVPAPDTGVEKHLSYMLQWYTFAAMAAGLWLWFSVRPRLRRDPAR